MDSERTIKKLYRWRLGILAFSVVALVLASFGATSLDFDFSPQRIFESRSDDYRYLQRIYDTFGRDDNLLLVHVRTDDVFQEPTIDYLSRLHDALGEIEGVTNIADITTALVVREGADTPSLLLDPRVTDLAEARELALQEPLIAGRFVSEDGSATLVVVAIDPEQMRFDQLSPQVHAFIETLERTPPPEDVEVMHTGIPAVRVLIGERILQDQLTFFPLCVVLFIVVLFVLFRDIRAIIVPLGAIAVALILGVGLLGFAGEDVNIVNNFLPILIFVIGVSDAIHLISRYRCELTSGSDQRRALWTTVRHLAFACLLTSITTAIGFGSLAVSRNSLVKHFGIQAAIGVMIAFGVTVVLIPLVLSYLKPLGLGSTKGSGDGSGGWGVARLCSVLVKISGQRAITVFLVTILGMGGALFLAGSVDEETQIYEAFPDDDPLVIANGRIEEDFAGVLPLSIVAEWDSGTSVLRPEPLAYIETLQEFVGSRDGLSRGFSIVDLLRERNFLKHNGDPSARRIPDSPEDCEEAMETLRRGLVRTGRGQAIDRVYAPDAHMLRIVTTVSQREVVEFREILDELEERITEDEALHRRLGLRFKISGDGPLIMEGITGLIEDMYSSLLLAFVIIFGMLCLVLRSLKLALVCMLPNIFPLVVTLGFMGLVGIDLRVTTVIVLAVSIGLAVDDTIHLAVRFQREWKNRDMQSDGYMEVMLKAVRGTGEAILITSIMLAGGFCVLLASQFPLTKAFALCMEVAIVAALFGDLVLLPACLMLFKPLGSARTTRTDGGKGTNESE